MFSFGRYRAIKMRFGVRSGALKMKSLGCQKRDIMSTLVKNLSDPLSV